MVSFKFSETPFLVCKDHSVSGEYFQLRKDSRFELLETYPQPRAEKLPAYYKSEDYISHTDSRKTFLEKTYQTVKTLMLGKKLDWIEKEVTTKGRLLDIGAGTGDFLVTAQDRGWDVYGQEPNPDARSLSADKGITLGKDTSNLPDQFFDVITLWHVLEHVPSLDKQIKELYRLLKKDGLLVIAVPNFNSYDAGIYREYWAAYDVPRHLHHFSRTSMERIFDKFGFCLTKERGLLFDSFYVSLLSEKNKIGKTNPAKAFLIGFLSNLKGKFSGEYSSITYFFKKA